MKRILDILRGRGLNPDGATDATIRTERNLEALAGLGSSDANSKHIEKRTLQRREANRLVKVAIRRIKSDKEAALTNIELYLDDWAFHHGPITKENAADAVADCVDRITRKHQAAQQLAEHAEENDLAGMQDYPF